MPLVLWIGVVEKSTLDDLTDQDFRKPDFYLTELSEKDVELGGDFIDFFISFMPKLGIDNQDEIKRILEGVGEDDFPIYPKLKQFKDKYPDKFHLRSSIAFLDEPSSKLVTKAILEVCAKGYEGIVSAFLNNKYTIISETIYATKEQKDQVSDTIIFDPEKKMIVAKRRFLDFGADLIPILPCESYAEFNKLCLITTEDGKTVLKLKLTDKKGNRAPDSVYAKIKTGFENDHRFYDMLNFQSIAEFIKETKKPIIWLAEA